LAALDEWASTLWRNDRPGAQRLLAVARAADGDPTRNRLREALERGQRTLLKKLAASDEVDRYSTFTILILVHALAHVDAKESAVQPLRRAQRLRPEDLWTNLALAELLSENPATRGEAVGFCRAALARRPHSMSIHFFLAHALQQWGKLRQSAHALRRAIELRPDSAWAHLLLADALTNMDRLPEALAEYRRAVQLRRRDDTPTLADANWFRQAARLVELDDELSAVLRGELQPRDAAERAELAMACRFRELEAAGARLYSEAFAQHPALAEQNRYYAAWAAVLAGLGKGNDAAKLDERERARLRGLALAWLRDEVDGWRQRLAKQPARWRAEILQRVNCWLRDPDLACLRDPEPLGRLPAAERADWERLWRELRELQKKAQTDAR
jgi:tetratricopeptide (TPR) repeat protein